MEPTQFVNNYSHKRLLIGLRGDQALELPGATCLLLADPYTPGRRVKLADTVLEGVKIPMYGVAYTPLRCVDPYDDTQRLSSPEEQEGVYRIVHWRAAMVSSRGDLLDAPEPTFEDDEKIVFGDLGIPHHEAARSPELREFPTRDALLNLLLQASLRFQTLGHLDDWELAKRAYDTQAMSADEFTQWQVDHGPRE